MTPLQNLAPLRWPSGPLEMAKREKTEGFDAAIRQTLELWHEPEALEVLKDTPIDCIVIGWAAGLPEDAAQQGSASRLLEAARRRNLAVVGWVEGAADPRAAMAAAKTAGLAAVAMANFTGSADLPVIAWPTVPAFPRCSRGPLSHRRGGSTMWRPNTCSGRTPSRGNARIPPGLPGGRSVGPE